MVRPEKLFKYRSLFTAEDRTRCGDIVRKSEIWCAAPFTFNDPFDCRPIFSMSAPLSRLRSYLIKLSKLNRPHLNHKQHEAYVSDWLSDPKRDPRTPELLSFMQAAHEERLTKSLGVWCGASTNTNILMWSHYADSHRGICLEFSALEKPFSQTSEVKYSSIREPVELVIEDEDTMARKSVLTKSDHWAYEGEWRIICKTGPQALSFNPEAITGLTMGANIDPSHEIDVRSWVTDHPWIKLYRAKPERRKFEMEIVPA